MKRVYLLFAVVAAQLLWLVWNYVARLQELAAAPVLRIECTERDPRDLFRGDYVALETRQFGPLELAGKSICWDAAFCESVNNDWAYVNEERVDLVVVNPLQPRAPQMEDSLKLNWHGKPERVAVFWRTGADGISRVVRFEKPGSPADVAEPEESRCLMWMAPERNIKRLADVEPGNKAELDFEFELSFNSTGWRRVRYYVEENTGDMYNIWVNQLDRTWSDFPSDRLRYTVDLAIRSSASVVPRQLYLNGVPYADAVEQIRQGTFEWLPEPADETKPDATPRTISIKAR